MVSPYLKNESLFSCRQNVPIDQDDLKKGVNLSQKLGSLQPMQGCPA
jgi:hypothetical protein